MIWVALDRTGKEHSNNRVSKASVLLNCRASMAILICKDPGDAGFSHLPASLPLEKSCGPLGPRLPRAPAITSAFQVAG